jgi:uncharacterized protein YkwD
MLPSTSLRKVKVRLQVEVLEDRDLLAGNIALANGALKVSGTPRNDTVTVSLAGDKLEVDLTGSANLSRTFNLAEVGSIHFNGNGGFDRLINNTSVPSRFNAGTARQATPEGRKRATCRRRRQKGRRKKQNLAARSIPGDIAADVSLIFAQLNALRAQYGRGSLVIDSILQAAAQQHASNMAIHGYGDGDANGHILFGQDGGDRARAAGYPFTPTTWLGENVAYNYGYGTQSAQQLMTQWTQSSGHFENMIGAAYLKVGIGVAYGWYNGEFRCYGVQMFATA